MIVAQTQEVSCLCGSLTAVLEGPGNAANSLISGNQSQLRWTGQSEVLEESEGWHFCQRCGTTVAHLGQDCAGVLGSLHLPLDAMHQAVAARDLQKVRELLARGLSADLEIYGRTPLMMAVEQREIEICRVLLEHGAMARLGLTREFFSHRSAELLRLLLAHGARPQPLLRPILWEGDLESAKLLLELGVDLDGVDQNGWTPLHCAAHNSADMIRLVAQHTSDFAKLSDGGGHALGFCALWGYTGRLKALLGAGFPVDLLQDDPADSALFAACREGNPGCVRALLESGANPGLRCQSVTPLMAASHSGSLKCVELLLKAGADPKARDDAGRYARDYAVAPELKGQHRFSRNSAGEQRVQLSFGRGRWTCLHKAIAAKLERGDGPGRSRLLAEDNRRIHCPDLSRFHHRSARLGKADWELVERAACLGSAEAQCLWGWHTAQLGWLRAAANHIVRIKLGPGRLRHQLRTVLAAELGLLEAMRDMAAALIHDEYERTGRFAEGYTKALPWYCRAAEGGHRESQVAGGSMLIQGDGAEPDPVKGLHFLEAAAASDDVDNAAAAAKQLARYYTGCYSLPADPEKASYWKHRAAVLALEDDLGRNELYMYSSRLRSP